MQLSVFTAAGRFMGTLETKFQRLTDVLLYQPQEYLILNECLVLPLHSEDDHEQLLPYVQIRRSNVLFAVHHGPIAHRADPAAASQEASPLRLQVAKRPHAVGLRVAGWRLRGNLHVVREGELQMTMMSLGIRGDTFVPLTGAYATHLATSRFDIGPETVIVQRDHSIAFWPLDTQASAVRSMSGFSARAG
jgi:hypothetical protein